MSSVKAAKMKGHGSKKKGKVREMRISKGAKPGTFISHVDRHSPEGGHGMYMGPSEDDAPTVHPSVSHMVKHVKSTMGGEGAEPDADDQAEAEAEPAA